MNEAAAAPAPVPEQPTPTSPENMVAKIRMMQIQQYADADRNERLTIARRGVRIETVSDYHGKMQFETFILGPSVEPTDTELKALVPLERDRIKYLKFATNRHGLFSVPKPHGRRNPHMTKRQQTIKSEAIRIFGRLFADAAKHAQEQCAKDGVTYVGMPDDVIPVLGARAAKIALRVVTGQHKEASRTKRRQQDFSRKVNVGILPRNANARAYVHAGGQYGNHSR